MYECPDATLTSIPPDHLMKELLGILQATPETCEHPVGALTPGRRDDWHNTREKLLLGTKRLRPLKYHSYLLELIQKTFHLCLPFFGGLHASPKLVFGSLHQLHMSPWWFTIFPSCRSILYDSCIHVQFPTCITTAHSVL